VTGTHPASGHFTNLADWKKGALGVINDVLAAPLQLKVVNVVGGGDEEWAVLELEANAVCKNGMKYHQRYAWVMRFDGSGTIVQVRSIQSSKRIFYMPSALTLPDLGASVS
jgi:ketosteroid isomerase-like protein